MYVDMAIAITQRKSHTATKNADSSGHRPNLPIPCFSVSFPDDLPGVSLLIDWRPSSFSSGLSGFRGHSSLCGLCANIDKERSSGLSSAASKMPEIKSPHWPPIHKHIETHTYTSIYIYIYTHTLTIMLIIAPQTNICCFVASYLFLLWYDWFL